MTPEAFRDLRKQVYSNQTQLANALGRGIMTVSRWESGKTAPKKRKAVVKAKGKK